jgi:hypothetical protein
MVKMALGVGLREELGLIQMDRRLGVCQEAMKMYPLLTSSLQSPFTPISVNLLLKSVSARNGRREKKPLLISKTKLSKREESRASSKLALTLLA